MLLIRRRSSPSQVLMSTNWILNQKIWNFPKSHPESLILKHYGFYFTWMRDQLYLQKTSSNHFLLYESFPRLTLGPWVKRWSLFYFIYILYFIYFILYIPSTRASAWHMAGAWYIFTNQSDRTRHSHLVKAWAPRFVLHTRSRFCSSRHIFSCG